MGSKALTVVVTDDTLTVDLEDGRTISVPIGLGVEGLLLGKPSSESQASLARWLARQRAKHSQCR